MSVASGSREERWSLAGATALVTGGSKGIGHAIVEELAGFGARVHTCARNGAELEACCQRWAEKGLQVTVSVCDVAVPADREALMDTVKATFDGKLDILVNNAAGLFPGMTGDELPRAMATNLESCFQLSLLARPLLRHSYLVGGGSIVNISSISSFRGFPGLTLYSMTKGNVEEVIGEDIQKDLFAVQEPLIEEANFVVADSQGMHEFELPEGVMPWDVQCPEGWTAYWESNPPPQ